MGSDRKGPKIGAFITTDTKTLFHCLAFTVERQVNSNLAVKPPSQVSKALYNFFVDDQPEDS